MSFLNHQTIVYENLQSKVTMIMEKSRQCPSRFDLCDISDEISDDKDMTSTVFARKLRFIFGIFSKALKKYENNFLRDVLSLT